MALLPRDDHPHGLPDSDFVDLFTADVDVVFAFHGYPRAVHELLHGRPNAARFHVRGFVEQGTTTTPFDMVVLNRTSRYHLVLEVLNRRELVDGRLLRKHCLDRLAAHRAYIREHFVDLPEVREWRWS